MMVFGYVHQLGGSTEAAIIKMNVIGHFFLYLIDIYSLYIY